MFSSKNVSVGNCDGRLSRQCEKWNTLAISNQIQAKLTTVNEVEPET